MELAYFRTSMFDKWCDGGVHRPLGCGTLNITAGTMPCELKPSRLSGSQHCISGFTQLVTVFNLLSLLFLEFEFLETVREIIVLTVNN